MEEYSRLLEETARKRLAKESLKIMSLLKTHELEPSLEHYNAALVANLGHPGQIREICQDMRNRLVSPDLVTFSALVRSCEMDGDRKGALSHAQRLSKKIAKKQKPGARLKQLRAAHETMNKLRLPASVFTTNTLIVELVDRGEWKDGLDVVHQAEGNGVKISLAVRNLLASAVEDAGLHKRAKKLRASSNEKNTLCFDDIENSESHDASTEESGDGEIDYYANMTTVDMSSEEKRKQWSSWEANPTRYYG